MLSLGENKADFVAAISKVMRRCGMTGDNYTDFLAKKAGYKPEKTALFLEGEWEKLGENAELVVRDHMQALGRNVRDGETLETLVERFIAAKNVRRGKQLTLAEIDRDVFAERLHNYINTEGLARDSYADVARNTTCPYEERFGVVECMLNPNQQGVTLKPEYFLVVAEDCGFDVPLSMEALVSKGRDKKVAQHSGIGA